MFEDCCHNGKVICTLLGNAIYACGMVEYTRRRQYTLYLYVKSIRGSVYHSVQVCNYRICTMITIVLLHSTHIRINTLYCHRYYYYYYSVLCIFSHKLPNIFPLTIIRHNNYCLRISIRTIHLSRVCIVSKYV